MNVLKQCDPKREQPLLRAHTQTVNRGSQRDRRNHDAKRSDRAEFRDVINVEFARVHSIIDAHLDQDRDHQPRSGPDQRQHKRKSETVSQRWREANPATDCADRLETNA